MIIHIPVWSPPDIQGAVEHGAGGAGVPTFSPPFPRIEWVPSLNAALGVDAMNLDDEALRNAARKVGVQKVESLSPPKILDEMFQALVESKLQEPTFVVGGLPVAVSPEVDVQLNDETARLYYSEQLSGYSIVKTKKQGMTCDALIDEPPMAKK